MQDISKENLKSLVAEKDKIEKEIQEIRKELDSIGVGLSGGLIDNAGFPRPDVDIPVVREQRHKVAELRTEHDRVMKQIEHGLQALHQKHKGEVKPKTSTQDQSPTDTPSQSETTTKKSFLLVKEVSTGSPAEESGLHVNDKIVEFGSITAKNPYGLSAVADVVKNSINRAIKIIVDRNGAFEVLSLVPHSWTGRGVLGCHLVPIKE